MSSTYSHIVCERGREQRNKQAMMLERYFLYSAPRLQEKLKYNGDYSMTCHVTRKLNSPLGGCSVKDTTKPKRRKDLSLLAACQNTGKSFPKQCLSEQQKWRCIIYGYMHIHEGAWAVDRVQALVDWSQLRAGGGWEGAGRRVQKKSTSSFLRFQLVWWLIT